MPASAPRLRLHCRSTRPLAPHLPFHVSPCPDVPSCTHRPQRPSSRLAQRPNVVLTRHSPHLRFTLIPPPSSFVAQFSFSRVHPTAAATGPQSQPPSYRPTSPRPKTTPSPPRRQPITPALCSRRLVLRFLSLLPTLLLIFLSPSSQLNSSAGLPLVASPPIYPSLSATVPNSAPPTRGRLQPRPFWCSD